MKKEILLYGDSNTWGFIPVPVSTPLALVRRDASLRWPCVTARALGEDYHVIEEGLSGRRSIYGTGEDAHVNGEPYLRPCLETHAPLDAVVIMLGTNDLRLEYGVTYETLGAGISRLIDIIQALPESGRDVKPPKILVVSPILVVKPEVRMDHYEARGCERGEQLSRAFAEVYARVAEEKGCEFLDAVLYANTSRIDGLHMDDASNEPLGLAIAEKIRSMFEE